MVTAKRGDQLVIRNSSFFKRLPRTPDENTALNEPTERIEEMVQPEQEREPEPAKAAQSQPRSLPSNPVIDHRPKRETKRPSKFNDFVVQF